LRLRWLGDEAFGDARGAEQRGVPYFADATLASAVVAACRANSKVETAGGVFHVRKDELAPRRR
jgi:hypothetical protein